MIISASRRTDIPAFYSQWFFTRLEEGFVMVRNPMNPRMVSNVSLSPELLDCIVFWTKNPLPMMDKLDRLQKIPFYFLFTITPYDQNIEKNLPAKETILNTFAKLSGQIGKERVIWRYDPVLLSREIDEAYHLRHFNVMARQLAPYTERCITSFLDMYKKCRRNLRGLDIKQPDKRQMIELAGGLNHIAGQYGIKMFSCAETIDYSNTGIKPGKCIDEALIQRISGYRLKTKKDGNQRKTCLCTQSIDIGAYNTCNHTCLYCYATSDAQTPDTGLHQPDSPLLTGQLSGNEIITERKVESLKISARCPGSLFDR